MSRIFIIAEVGVNHNADMNLAKRLVDVAVDAGADAIKFQAAIPEFVVTASAEKAEYQKKSSGTNESQLDMIRRIHFPLEAYNELQGYCYEKGIIFFATAFDLKSLEYLEFLDQPFHNIPSGEITNKPYLKAIGTYNKPTILSTGMADMTEIKEAISVLKSAGLMHENLTVLHCNTEYPSPMEDLNLRAMQSIADEFDVKVGYSDHSEGIEVAVCAASLGATVIEKHITMDKTLPGPDHKASLEPNEFKAMVSAVRNIEKALGGSEKTITPSESKNRIIARRSIVAARPIKAGELFTAENMIAKRPGDGISPMFWDEVIGKPAPCDFDKDEKIRL